MQCLGASLCIDFPFTDPWTLNHHIIYQLQKLLFLPLVYAYANDLNMSIS